MSQGLSLPEAHACATDSLNAAFDRVLEYLLGQARNSFDSSMVRFRYEYERQKPRIGTVAELTEDVRFMEFQSPPGDTLICIEFSGEVSSDTSRNVTLYCQAAADPACPGAIDPWQCVASWNYNGSATPRYFAVRDGTGNYRLCDNSNSRPVRLSVTWPVAYHEPTPSDPPVYPAYSLGWPDKSGAEFATGLGLGQQGGVYQPPPLSAPYSLCEIPRYLGGPYYSSLLISYDLLADTDHPELYDYTDPLAPYAGDIVITVFAEALFDAEGVSLETLAATLNVASGDTPVGSFELIFTTTAGSLGPEIQPAVVTLPPIGVGRLNIELVVTSSGSSAPGMLGLDAILVDFNGPIKSGCCVGRVGDANGSGDDEPTIGDISVMIDALFIGGDPLILTCLAETDINQSGGAVPTATDITIGDISILIDYLFITGPSLGLPDCL